jgi:hypothetical protein
MHPATGTALSSRLAANMPCLVLLPAVHSPWMRQMHMFQMQHVPLNEGEQVYGSSQGAASESGGMWSFGNRMRCERQGLLRRRRVVAAIQRVYCAPCLVAVAARGQLPNNMHSGSSDSDTAVTACFYVSPRLQTYACRCRGVAVLLAQYGQHG